MSQLQHFGAPAGVVAKVAARQAEQTVVEVLECNWNAVQVYQRCQLTYVGGGMGMCCTGIAAAEVHQAIDLMRMPKIEWPELLDGVQHMGRVAAGLINTAAKDGSR